MIDSKDTIKDSDDSIDSIVIGDSRVSKHDSYVNALREDIECLYDNIITNYTFYSRSKKTRKEKTKGEVDLIAIKGECLHAFEVKCSNRIVKAKHQLKKIKKRLKHDYSGKEIKTFFYCGNSGRLHEIEI